MLAQIKRFFLWNQAQRQNDYAQMSAVLKVLWPWCIPLWILPAFLISDMFVNGRSNHRLLVLWLPLFVGCFLLLFLRSWKVEMGRATTILVFKFVPLLVLLFATAIWIVIHDARAK